MRWATFLRRMCLFLRRMRLFLQREIHPPMGVLPPSVLLQYLLFVLVLGAMAVATAIGQRRTVGTRFDGTKKTQQRMQEYQQA